MMKKKIFFVLMVLFSFNFINAQSKKNLNLIISINDKVVIGAIRQIRLIAIFEDTTKENISVDYFPGNLSILETDYNKLLSVKVKAIYLAFNYIDRCNKEEKEYNYEIDINKGWLEHYFYILNIYNTDRKKYKELFTPLEGKNYTYEVFYPGGSTSRITKKKRNLCN